MISHSAQVSSGVQVSSGLKEVVVFPSTPTRNMSLVDLGKRLLDAAKRGETEEVRTLMSNGAPFTTDWLGTSPLHFSAQYGHIETAEVLLRAGISRDARTKVDRTPLHVAAQEGHVDIVELLVSHQADIDAKDMLKMTPLHWATEKGHFAVIETLLKHGADVTCENKFDRTPLDIAIGNGRADLAQLLQLVQMTGSYDASVHKLVEDVKTDEALLNGNVVHHTEIAGITEGESITIETTEATEEVQEVETETETETIETVVTTTDSMLTDSLTKKILPVQLIQNISTSKGEESEGSDQGNSSVLETLAALAEATAPNTSSQNSTTSDAMSWLESQGITMIATNSEGGMISSAVESGQTITLTEAGIKALNIIKQQGLQQEEVSEETLETVEDEDPDSQKVITIVAQPQSTDIEAETEQCNIVTMTTDGSGDAQLVVSEDVETEEPPSKIMKIDCVEESSEDVEQLLEGKDGVEAVEKEHLKKQLEEMQKQAEAYKLQLKQKEQEAEQYKKKLSEIETS